jgi:hypothetical protein
MNMLKIIWSYIGAVIFGGIVIAFLIYLAKS